MSDHEDCPLCAGSGEVSIVPAGAPDSEESCYGCPICIAQERDEENAKLHAQLVDYQAKFQSLQNATETIQRVSDSRDQRCALLNAARDEEIARLTADNIRLRAALEQIEGMSDYALSMDATQVARDALNRSAP